MPSLREVKNRIKSVNNIGQITRALEAVSASRVRKAQARAFATRAYAEKAWEILLNVQKAMGGQAQNPLLINREDVRSAMVIVITSDRGLAGSYNTNILRAARRYEDRFGKPVKYVAVGRKGRDSLIRSGVNVVAEFSDLPSEPRISDIRPIARVAKDAFIEGEVDEVLIAYTDFINILTQRPVVMSYLPLTPDSTAQNTVPEYMKDLPQVTDAPLDYEVEPNPAAVIDEIVPRFVELILYQAFLEAQASEHAARMAAMRNATSNAGQLKDDLTLEYNKARQASITSEILDIVGGAEALQASIDSAADSMLGGDAGAQTIAVTPSSNGHVASAQTEEESKTPEPEAESQEPDDLTLIEGIGATMAGALNAAGIDTFQKLADSDEATLRAALDAAGMRFAPSLVTWAEQAAYAAKGDWEGLHRFQDRLNAGRKEDLTKIEGIGKKISEALIAAGVDNYKKLANSDEETLRAALESAGMRFAPSLVTWAEQASYAAKSDWEGLHRFQDRLSAGRKDDLTKIEGIGKKISAALIAAGVDNYRKLANSDEETLRAALESAGMRFAPSLVTWAEQAKFAAKGDWDGLKRLQDDLTAGRRTD